MRCLFVMAILVSCLLTGPKAFAGDDAITPFLGTWEYRMRDPDSPTGYADEGERLELNEKGGSIQGLYFGLQREGEHGLWYTLVEIKNVEVSEGGKITFIVPFRRIYPVRPSSLAEAEEINKHHGSGFTRIEMKFQGQLKNGHLILQCISDAYECPEDVMVFRKGKGDTEKVQALPTQGTDVNAKVNKGNTALIKAAQNGKTNTVRALLAQDADVNAKENQGITALMWAAQEGHTDMVQALLAKGADVNATANSGYTGLKLHVNATANSGPTALMLAKKLGHKEIVRILKEAGAKE
jgi:hypothetical protein